MDIRTGKVVYVELTEEELHIPIGIDSDTPIEALRKLHPNTDVIIGNMGGSSVILFNNLGRR